MPDLAISDAGRLALQGDRQQRLRQAARAFEAQFLQRLLQPLAERADEEEELFGGDGAGDQWRALFVQGLAEHSAGSLGIAALIERTLAARLQRPQ
ncbi:MAG: hypothetical protein RMM29_00915 [Planctomycetota bacterium]|nr:hypothetical protein [Planctomycetota bacterium]MCX8039086.1 hypothetical protein [Planctomycetota bacterium]MDW8372196.1 hypothetical protein [Planctomycetota bacterium]